MLKGKKTSEEKGEGSEEWGEFRRHESRSLLFTHGSFETGRREILTIESSSKAWLVSVTEGSPLLIQVRDPFIPGVYWWKERGQ